MKDNVADHPALLFDWSTDTDGWRANYGQWALYVFDTGHGFRGVLSRAVGDGGQTFGIGPVVPLRSPAWTASRMQAYLEMLVETGEWVTLSFSWANGRPMGDVTPEEFDYAMCKFNQTTRCPHCDSSDLDTGIRTDPDTAQLRKRCYCNSCRREFWRSEARLVEAR